MGECIMLRGVITALKEARLAESMDFNRLPLVEDDLLPREIILLLAYRRLPAIESMGSALHKALEKFPHLTGRIVNDAEKGGMPLIAPSFGKALTLEHASSSEPLGLVDLEGLSPEEHRTLFVPGSVDFLEGPLLAIRRIDFTKTEMGVLCLRVSHMAVDGAGLAMFLWEAARHLKGGDGLVPRHDRGWQRGEDDGTDWPSPLAVPFGYREGVAQPSDGTDDGETLWFSVEAEDVRRVLADHQGDTQRCLAAWICGELAQMDRRLKHVAVWCNTRGRGGVPWEFTGNAGCYEHLPLEGGRQVLERELRLLASRSGLQAARKRHRDILALRRDGREIGWDGPKDELLELNLVSPPASSADFGTGSPEIALLLERNSTGIRILPTAGGGGHLVEATLKRGLARGLYERALSLGLAPRLWGKELP